MLNIFCRCWNERDYQRCYPEESLVHPSEWSWWDKNIRFDWGVFMSGILLHFLDVGPGRCISDVDVEALVDGALLSNRFSLSVGASPVLSCPGVMMKGSGPELMRTGAID
ncbi:hypothetical protein Tco_0448757 [Tanacetum coccineum]